MKLKACFLTLTLSLFVSAEAKASCSSNEALKSNGFEVHKTGFNTYFEDALDYYDSNPDLFEDDLDDVIFSSSANALVHVQSFDALDTPRELMWGDLVVMRDWRTGEKVEVRWYDENGKHVAYNRSYQGCATNVVPMAFNTLF